MHLFYADAALVGARVQLLKASGGNCPSRALLILDHAPGPCESEKPFVLERAKLIQLFALAG